MIFRHYRELATPAQAEEWFGMKPAHAAARNVVSMAS